MRLAHGANFGGPRWACVREMRDGLSMLVASHWRGDFIANQRMKSYYLTKRSKSIYFVVSLLTLAALLGLFFYIFPHILCFQLYVSALALFSFYSLIQKLRDEHIVISENGIEYYAPGVIFGTDWKNLERIVRYWRNGFQHDCLVVDNSRIRMKKWSLWGGRNIPMPFGFTALHKTLIPLSGFSDNWRNSDLGQQIKQYAPHLFKQEKSLQSVN